MATVKIPAQLALPFDHEVLAFAITSHGNTVALVKRTSGREEYVTYRVQTLLGDIHSCFWGHYFSDYSNATADFCDRTVMA